ncbi:MAG: hypothetical protein HYW86_00960 [Candidatus Roizmanbacteria bacterium]|nr:MAG: hypothetical protein HYW86_00960 [Candidatus Roizmanbacteria bacterium]
MKKSTKIFLILLLAVIGIIAFTKNNNPSSIKLQDKIQQQNETPKIEKPASSTQSAENIGKDEINLNINSPANNIVTNQPSVAVEGTTIPKAFVFVNEQELRADDLGNFSTTVNLDEGDNFIVVVASDEGGNNSEKELIVTYDPGETQ